MDIVKELRQIVGEKNVRTDQIERLCHSRDMSVHEGIPDAVVFASSTEEVSKILKLAYENDIKVIPRGSGTSTTGAVLACFGGIILDVSRMNKIKEIQKKDGYAVVEPGVICAQLNAALAPTHFFPPDPGSATIASIGGMVATNASGNRAIKYGTTKDYVMAMEVVLADGRVFRTGSTAPKTSSGYDLVHLFARSEGTLGVMTEITVKILPMPEYIAFAQLWFPEVEDAGKAAEGILGSGIPLSSCEILDRVSIEVVNKAMGLNIPENVGCILFIEIDGNRQAVKENIEKINRISKECNSLGEQWDDDPARRLKMWAGRQGLVPSLSKLRRGAKLVPLVEDFGVPISKIPETIRKLQAIRDKHNFPIPIFGHIGDGNLHAVLIIDGRKKEEWEVAKKIAQDFIDLTMELKGTLTAEHGIGIAKAPYIHHELGIGQEVMRAIKKALDPKNILNPGKLGLDDETKDIYAFFTYKEFVETPEKIKSFGPEVDNEIFACINCGFCRAGCTVYARTGLESENARGRVIQAYYMMKGLLEPSKEVADKFYLCTTCLNCKATCPAGVVVSEIVEAGRRKLVEAGFLPEIHKTLMENLRATGNPFGEPREKRTDVYPSTFKPKEGPVDALFFPGCVASFQDVNIVPNLMNIFEKAGISYTALGKDENCCGYISYLVGTEEFKEVGKKNVEAISKVQPKQIVTTCAGCYKTFKELYPKYLAFQTPVVNAIEYLDQLLQNGQLKFKEIPPVKVAYHDPCDLGRHLNIFEPPRDLLKKIPGVTLIEFKNNRLLAKCCGGGGGMKAFNTELSGEIAYQRMLEALEVGAETVVSACPACKANLQVAAARLRKEKKGKIKVMDITELVAEALA
ncbi:MAG: FAD-binding oxidoreductase [Desulfobacterota bacterium]|nr:FAD-binding oxidoreductase [Thermodesulfobacteriota bacterium]